LRLRNHILFSPEKQRALSGSVSSFASPFLSEPPRGILSKIGSTYGREGFMTNERVKQQREQRSRASKEAHAIRSEAEKKAIRDKIKEAHANKSEGEKKAIRDKIKARRRRRPFVTK